ncbi:MAG: type VI secretion system tube protein TssD [Methanobacteriota archaeon]
MEHIIRKKPLTSNILIVVVIFGLLVGIAVVLGDTSFVGRYLFSDSRSDTLAPIVETSVEMIILGQNQGLIEGEGHNGTILIEALDHEVGLAYNNGTGNPTGTRYHEPLCVLKLLDKSSPMLWQALCQNESLTITLNWYRRDPGNVKAVWQQYYTITLQNAKIVIMKTYDKASPYLYSRLMEQKGIYNKGVSLKNPVDDGGQYSIIKYEWDTSDQHVEEISFTYETIIWSYNLGQGEEQGDSWSLKTIYVDDDYNSSTSGWQINHFDTIQDGINRVEVNGTVLIYNGTYIENLYIPKTLCLQGENNERTIIDGGQLGTVIIVAADNVIITGFTIRNGINGVFLDYCVNTTIFSNIIDSNIGMIEGSGILSSYSNNTTMVQNQITNNFFGISLIYSDNNIIIENIIAYSSSNGIHIIDSNNNFIYHNNFISNAIQTSCSPGTTNIWNDSYPYCGNHWNDFDGSDHFHGPNQNIPGPDNICDSPYPIEGENNQDHYPLMEPWGYYIEGFCSYEDTIPTLLSVEITNLNTGKKLNAGIIDNYYRLMVAVGEDITIGEHLRFIAKDITDCINVTEYEITGEDIVRGFIRLNLTLDIHYRDLKRFPFYVSEVNTGAMVMKQMMDYLMWNSTINPERPPSVYNEQTLFNQYKGADDTINGSELCNGLNTEIDDFGNGWIYGYFFAPSARDQAMDALRDAVIWLDYNISGANDFRSVDVPKTGHPWHVPIAVPTSGTYDKWMVLRGIHTNRSMWDTTNPGDHELITGPVTIHGFWLNDPQQGGIGGNTYVTAQYFTNAYFQRITITGDLYYNKFLVITDPPRDQPIPETSGLDLTLAETPQGFSVHEAELVAQQNKRGMKTTADTIVTRVAFDEAFKVLRYDPIGETFEAANPIGKPLYKRDTCTVTFGNNSVIFTVILNKQNGALQEIHIQNKSTLLQ